MNLLFLETIKDNRKRSCKYRNNDLIEWRHFFRWGSTFVQDSDLPYFSGDNQLTESSIEIPIGIFKSITENFSKKWFKEILRAATCTKVDCHPKNGVNEIILISTEYEVNNIVVYLKEKRLTLTTFFILIDL